MDQSSVSEFSECLKRGFLLLSLRSEETTMKKSVLFTLIAGVGLALPATTYGQAIIGYGINVGRAGAAGVGAGAGLAGVFSKVNQPIKKAGQEGANRSHTGRQAGPQFDNDKVPKGNGQAKVGADGKLKLKGGATIAGLSPSPRVARSSQLSTEARAIASSGGAESYSPAPTPAPGPGPSAAPATTAPESSEVESADAKPAEEDPAATDAQVTAESSESPPASEQALTTPASNRSVLSPVIITGSGSSENSSGEEGAAKEGTIIISDGATVADLIARLGKPTMVLKGIRGNGYNEKYTFRKPDGTKFTVLALHGKIISVIDNSTRLPMRASLP